MAAFCINRATSWQPEGSVLATYWQLLATSWQLTGRFPATDWQPLGNGKFLQDIVFKQLKDRFGRFGNKFGW
jgi:hypothetical protein